MVCISRMTSEKIKSLGDTKVIHITKMSCKFLGSLKFVFTQDINNQLWSLPGRDRSPANDAGCSVLSNAIISNQNMMHAH